MDKEEIRKEIEKQIFIVLNTKLNKDNKTQYCIFHAKERATIIENSLFKNCLKMHGENWEVLYENIDVALLVDKVEQKTTICMYG